MTEYNTGNYDKYMSKNPLKRMMVNRLNERVLCIIRQAAGNEKRTYKILDAGCGEGFITSLIFDNFTNVEITGLEYTPEAVAQARKRNGHISFIQGDVCHMPFEDGAFDLVICMEVLEHLERPDAALKELSRVSKNEVLLTVPDEPWFCLGNLLVLKNVKRFGNPIDHRNHWTYHKFIKYVKKFLPEGGCFGQKSFPWSIVVYKKGREL